MMSVRTTSKEGAYYNSAPRGDGWKNVVRRFEVNRDRENVNTNFDHDNKYKRREDNTHIPRKYACNCKRGAKGDGGELMIFTPGYRHISVFNSLLAPDNQRLKAWLTTYLAKRPAHPSHPP